MIFQRITVHYESDKAKEALEPLKEKAAQTNFWDEMRFYSAKIGLEVQHRHRLAVTIAALFICLLSTLLQNRIAHAATCPKAGSIITADITWDTDCAIDGLFFDTTTIATGAKLTISPGVTVRVTSGGDFVINGQFVAQGTTTNPIRFTSGETTVDKGDWGGIIFNPGSNGVIDHATIEYGSSRGGSSGRGLIDIRSSNVTLKNCTIKDSEQNAVYIKDASPVIGSCSFTNNNWAGINLTGNSLPTLSSLQASNNGYEVYVDTDALSANYAWGNQGLHNYYLNKALTVKNGVTLTIASGTVIRFGSGSGLTIDGRLIAIGTTAAPIRLTSGREVVEKGQWNGLIFNPNSSGTLQSSIVEYGGSLGGAQQALLTISSSDVKVANSTFAHSRSAGIKVLAGNPSITKNNIVDTDSYGLYNKQSSPVIASCNWWGAASGPTDKGNPQGTGLPVGGPIIYDPWLIAEYPNGECKGTVPKVFLPIILK